MGIGAGLLGFVQGASSSLGAAAAQQVQSDIDLERQLSLEQITAQRNKTRTMEQIKALQDNLDEDDPRREIDPTVGLKGFEFLSEDIEGKEESAAKKQERLDEVAARTNLFIKAGENPLTARDLALSDVDISLKDIQSNSVSPLNPEQLGALSNVTGMDREEIQLLRSAGVLTDNNFASIVQAQLSKAGKGQKTNTRLLVNKESGARIEVPVDEAVSLLSLNENGEQLFEPGEIKTIDGKSFVVTPSRRIEIPTDGESATRAGTLLDRTKQTNRGDTPIGKALAQRGMEFVNPVALTGRDELSSMRGPFSVMGAVAGGRPLVGDILENAPRLVGKEPVDLSESRIRAQSQIANLTGQSRIFFGAEGTRPLGAVLENLLKQLESPNALQGFMSRDSKTYTQLSTLRTNIKTELDRQRELAKAEDISVKEQQEAARMVRVGVGILETVDTMFANRLIEDSKVRLINGDMVPVPQLTWEDKDDVDQAYLNNNRKADIATTLWFQKLKLENQGKN